MMSFELLMTGKLMTVRYLSGWQVHRFGLYMNYIFSELLNTIYLTSNDDESQLMVDTYTKHNRTMSYMVSSLDVINFNPKL
ncbi:unnamed protein product [Rotaria magnacalcarata]